MRHLNGDRRRDPLIYLVLSLRTQVKIGRPLAEADPDLASTIPVSVKIPLVCLQ